MKKHFNIRVFGLVQGVWFRKNTKDQAVDFGLTGFVRNEKDGSVYIEADGNPAELLSFVEWCKVGPTRAAVEKVIVEEREPIGMQAFHIQ